MGDVVPHSFGMNPGFTPELVNGLVGKSQDTHIHNGGHRLFLWPQELRSAIHTILASVVEMSEA
jgi:hypothetical protein